MKRSRKRYKKKCRTCGRIYYVAKWEKDTGRRKKFCSAKCVNWNEYFPKGKGYFKGKHLSRAHRRKLSETRLNNPNVRGEKHWNFKGVWQMKNGYRFVLKPEHPFASSRGYVAEHRLVLERKLGRYLRPDEETHHINEIKSDNREENLEVRKKRAPRKYHTSRRWQRYRTERS